MLGTAVKCPGLVKNHLRDDVVCGYEGYEILEYEVFTQDSGFDPLAWRVKCRRCGHIYYVFPALTYKEPLSYGGR